MSLEGRPLLIGRGRLRDPGLRQGARRQFVEISPLGEKLRQRHDIRHRPVGTAWIDSVMSKQILKFAVGKAM